MNILIIGSNGYIGRHLALKLQEKQKVSLYLADIHPNSTDKLPNYQQIDATDMESVETLRVEEMNIVFMMTGLTGTGIAFKNYNNFLNINDLTLLNTLTHLKNTKSPARIIFPSSRLVYKGKKNTYLKEGSEKATNTIYAVNKQSCENYLKIYQNCFGIDYTTFRICVPYGNLIDDVYSYGTIGFMLGRASQNQAISLYGTGEQKRTFTHIGDLVNQMIGGALHPDSRNQTYNIGSPKTDTLSLLEAAQKVATKYKVGVTHVDWPPLALAIESGDTIFDGSKLEQLLAYKYEHDFSNWLNEI